MKTGKQLILADIEDRNVQKQKKRLTAYSEAFKKSNMDTRGQRHGI